MRTPDPVNLRLTFVPRGGGAYVQWQSEVLGTRLSRLGLPLPAADLPLVLRALDVLQDPAYPFARTSVQARHFSFSEDERTRLVALDLWSEPGRVARDAPQRLGRRLFAALTSDESGRAALATVRDHATALGQPLSLELCFTPSVARLAALPWELLWDAGPAPLLLGRGAPASLVRRLELPQALPPPRQGQGPLRILAITPHAGISPELRQMERAARHEAFAPLVAAGRAVITEVAPADRAALMRAIEAHGPPEVVHFYGHGRLRGSTGELLLDDPLGAGWVPAGALVAALGEVSLVTLFACHGAGAGDPIFGSVAQALVAAGVPAVLGMQLAVRAIAATRAATTIYAALASGASLQDGVGRARRALFTEEQDAISWFVPALFLRDRSGGPFRLRPLAPQIQATAPREPTTNQTVIASDGGRIRALHLQGHMGSQQTVIAAGGSISDVRISHHKEQP
ncbi:MAG: CHAT domain-containing protein [Oscillochloridaceae bacterium umkhey_bin13]